MLISQPPLMCFCSFLFPAILSHLHPPSVKQGMSFDGQWGFKNSPSCLTRWRELWTQLDHQLLRQLPPSPHASASLPSPSVLIQNLSTVTKLSCSSLAYQHFPSSTFSLNYTADSTLRVRFVCICKWVKAVFDCRELLFLLVETALNDLSVREVGFVNHILCFSLIYLIVISTSCRICPLYCLCSSFFVIVLLSILPWAVFLL